MLLVVEPIFEADSVDSSYGFRPGRSALDALAVIRQHLQTGRREVYDADLQGYFDTIPHDELLKCLRMRVVDRSILEGWRRRRVRHRKGGVLICRSKCGFTLERPVTVSGARRDSRSHENH